MAQPWLLPFLDALRTTGVVAQACRAAGVASITVYTARKSDADFANAWDNALEDSIDILEGEARRRAVDGIDEPIVYQGQLTPLWERDERGDMVMEQYETAQTYPAGHPHAGEQIMGSRPRQLVIDGVPQFLTVKKKSDPLLMFLLKGLRKKYGTETTELTGANGAPIAIDSTQRAARVAALMEVARMRKDAAVDDCSDLV